MQTDAWQSLFTLESRDGVALWFKRIHHRDINARRAKEITSSATQAREFFRNSSHANDSVRPLLTYYGVASLSRALTLLLRPDGGEQVLAKGHGLETIGWSETLSGDLGQALAGLGSLKVRTCTGAFNDLVSATMNYICLHVNSSDVDGGLGYPVPPLGSEASLIDMLSRLPDLRGEFERLQKPFAFANVKQMTYSCDTGLKVTVDRMQFEQISASYTVAGFKVAPSGRVDSEVTCDTATMESCSPQFMHTFVHKQFGAIPALHIVDPLPSGARYSQLALTYMVSFMLGMLARYFPTHWISLASGEKGDGLWPAINAAQRYVDQAFPELVVEFVEDLLRRRDRELNAGADGA